VKEKHINEEMTVPSENILLAENGYGVSCVMAKCVKAAYISNTAGHFLCSLWRNLASAMANGLASWRRRREMKKGGEEINEEMVSVSEETAVSAKK
jgi:hypothetical protein